MSDDKQVPAPAEPTEIVISDSQENPTPTQTRERLTGQLRPDTQQGEAEPDSTEPDNEDG